MIYVFVSGGVVSDVCYDHEDKSGDVVIVDYDVDGADDDRIHELDGERAFVACWEPSPLGDHMRAAFERISPLDRVYNAPKGEA